MGRLRRSRKHDFPSDERPVTCTRCGYTLREGVEKRDLCPGMDQTSQLANTGSLDRSTPLSPVSDSNSEGIITDTALSDWIREQPCILSGQPGHACRGDVVAHHVRARAHHGDWTLTNDGRIVGNVVPLCAVEGHQGGNESVHEMGRSSFEQHWGVDLEHAARRYGEEFPGEPPQRVRDRTQLREAKSE